jgi:hypothetical protein
LQKNIGCDRVPTEHMKTIILTVNGRESFGEPVKELVVGVYQVCDEVDFKKTVEEVGNELNKGDWIAPRDRPATVKQKLESLGYVTLKNEKLFVPIF